jgi:hypothetical protein
MVASLVGAAVARGAAVDVTTMIAAVRVGVGVGWSEVQAPRDNAITADPVSIAKNTRRALSTLVVPS